MKRMKKLFAILMTMAMVMGLSITGFAAKTGASIVVTGLSTNGNQTVKVYELYRLDENDNDWEKASWVPVDIQDMESVSEEDLSTIVSAITENEIAPSYSKENILNGTATFSDLQAGAYLVIASDQTNKVTYNPMIAKTYEYGTDNLIKVAQNVPVIAKTKSYSTEKDLINDSKNDNVVAVGDIKEYKITTTVPYVSDGNNIEEFWVSDTLSGAEYYFTGDNSKFEVTLDGVKQPSFSAPNAIEIDDKQQFTLYLNELLDEQNTNAGKTVVITYTVKITAVDQITNEAKTSHDPKGDTETAYTGQMQIEKLGEADTEGNRPKLAGAEFAVYRKTADGKKEYATINEETGYITGTWTSVEETASAPENVSTVTTGLDGIAIVKGLDVGTYYFEEIVAPDGYQLNSGEFASAECVITKTEKDQKVTVFGKTTMNNTKLSALPSTGGMGTTIFTIVGCVIMISAAGLFFASRRKAN